MNKEEKDIEIVKEITFVRGIRKDVEGEREDLLALEEVLNLIDKLQKQLDKLKEVDRQICCEELITKDKYQDILKENDNLNKKNKRYEKYLKNKDIEHNKVLEYIETEKERDYISKDIIRDKIKELEEEQKKEIEETNMSLLSVPIRILKELLGE